MIRLTICCLLLALYVTPSEQQPSQQDINSFAKQLDGYILQASDPGYTNITSIDNGRIHDSPLLIVVAESIRDIQQSLYFSQTYNITFSILGGGHSAAGYCLNTGGLVLSMREFLNVTIQYESSTIVVQGGALWMHVYDALNNTDFFVVGGACSTVGVSGFMQGGGMSWLSRSYGLCIDNLLSVSLVLANGTFVTVGVNSTNASEQDLFWALRGGGGGNWGVITEMIFQLHPLTSPTFMSAQLCWPISWPQTTNAMQFYSEWVKTIPNELAVYSSFVFVNGSLNFCNTPVYNGPYAEGLALIQPLLKFNPTATFLNSSFIEMEAIDGGRTAVAKRKAYIKSGYFPNGLSFEILDLVRQMMEVSPSKSTMFLFIQLGGKIAEYGTDETAYFHRSAQFDWEIKAVWDQDNEESTNVAFALDIASKIDQQETGAYVNYIDPYLDNWQTEYYGGNYPNLVRIKKEWDPANFFSFNQSVGK